MFADIAVITAAMREAEMGRNEEFLRYIEHIGSAMGRAERRESFNSTLTNSIST
jgi:hypothetical protein